MYMKKKTVKKTVKKVTKKAVKGVKKLSVAQRLLALERRLNKHLKDWA